MQGTIKITAIHHDDGPQIVTDVDLSNVNFQDKTFLINAFLKGLRIPPHRGCNSSAGYPQRPC